ncbi:hypothetical protein D0T12_29075 [Actinomadura spongiicola]|uniref:Uncharacterized protein n=1 Tax=Actinomadura spongiicola TaxID=2303421 RepID=A0A372G8T2_9ACTN|nr:hypothetical protein [Actinomadura spongiicola]RFS81781.1 hypothetical protein D0T12_29075 [Actinomadura spongiicola]
MHADHDERCRPLAKRYRPPAGRKHVRPNPPPRKLPRHHLQRLPRTIRGRVKPIGRAELVVPVDRYEPAYVISVD